MHPHLVVPRTQIKFGKELCTPKFIQKLFNNRNWELIFDYLLVESTIIYAESPGIIVLLYKQHRGRKRRRAGAYNSLL
jgi:hypothetical protein